MRRPYRDIPMKPVMVGTAHHTFLKRKDCRCIDKSLKKGGEYHTGISAILKS
jgi:hypothetical protein